MQILVYDGPKRLRIEEAPSPALPKDHVRVRTMFSAVSHGSEMSVYRGVAPFFRKKVDSSVRLFRPADEQDAWQYPIRSNDPGVWYMGYACVGEVVETNGETGDAKVGDIVYCNAPHQSESIVWAGGAVKLPNGLDPEHGVFFTNLMTAYNGILDTRIKLGDTVVVSGLGVLGQLVVQLAKMSGARVIGVDVLERRLETAKANGADYVFNAAAVEDVAYEIRKLTGNRGADAVIDVSGNHKSLQQAIRIVAPDCQVTALGWYQGAGTDLNFSEEFHHNRVTIRSSHTVYVDPSIRHMWDNQRKEQTCLELLTRLKLDNLVTHRYEHARTPDAFGKIDSDPRDIIQVVISYGG